VYRTTDRGLGKTRGARRLHVRALLFAALATAVVACGSGSDAASADEETNPSDSAVVTTASSETSVESQSRAQDASEIDWATVDLTTIDWDTIDMSQIDFPALIANPTASDLDSETKILIGNSMNPGAATLTIGAQTWESDSFLCAFGHDATQSDTYSFSSDARSEHEGARVQVQANIADQSGQGRFEGPDLNHQVYITDIDDFDNPSIDFEFNAPEGISIDGNTVTAEGLFDDKLTPGVVEEIPGALDATCGDGSRR